jgi:hypothetical protein
MRLPRRRRLCMPSPAHVHHLLCMYITSCACTSPPVHAHHLLRMYITSCACTSPPAHAHHLLRMYITSCACTSPPVHDAFDRHLLLCVPRRARQHCVCHLLCIRDLSTATPPLACTSPPAHVHHLLRMMHMTSCVCHLLCAPRRRRRRMPSPVCAAAQAAAHAISRVCQVDSSI